MSHIPPFRRLAVVALVAASALGLAACGKSDKPAGNAAAAAEPKTIDGARAAAQTVFDRFSGGDYAGAWDLYAADGQAAISQADYVKLNTACARKGAAITITSARLAGPDQAVVIAKQLVSTQSYTMVYQANAWKLEPAKEGIALYKLGADKAIAIQKKAGTCAGAAAGS